MKAEIENAAGRIGAHVRTTPLVWIEGDTLGLPAPVALKLELLQHTGSFKPRGAFNRLLAAKVPTSGVIAASGGNHGAAVAYAARKLGARAEIFVPRPTPSNKVARVRDYGGVVHQIGEDYAEAYARMQARAEESGALVVHAYDDADVVAGQGTLGRELQAQLEHIDCVFIAVGGGGLIAGVAGWFQGQSEVIAVEPESCPTLHSALRTGAPVDVRVSGVAADSLGARRIGDIAFEVCSRFVGRTVLVTDDEIRHAQTLLWEHLRIVAEPGGAAALAGLLSGRHGVDRTARVAVVVCGGNVRSPIAPPE